MGRLTRTALKIWVCSAILLVVAVGCNFTIGPQVERKAIIVVSGLPVEILESKTLECHVVTEKDGEVNAFKQNIGGWIAMPPEHWKTVKAEVERLRADVKRLKIKCNETEPDTK